MITPDHTANIVKEYMDKLYAQANDPDRYFLHREHDKVMLVGVCIVGRLLGLEKATEYYLFARSALEKEPSLDKALLTMPTGAAVNTIAEQLALVINDDDESEQVRHEYRTILEAMRCVMKYSLMTSGKTW